MVTMVEVRCCCQPQKLLGWLPVPETILRPGRVVTFSRLVCAFNPLSEPLERAPDIRDIRLPLEYFHQRWPAEGEERVALALKSEETPMSVLRQIPGFVPNQHGEADTDGEDHRTYRKDRGPEGREDHEAEGRPATAEESSTR